ncbi:MAG: ornithine--oxo-acid transaminase [Rhodospirillales bacterium]|nr:ornithine--oxo-acid transaminase [Rhodospirillales bacterium]MCB9964614.1 ornithine--oxo-acid transaminase [Rhodospirillales bacterium]MCB9979903.1 ornithine--oxo-acid transaminase [Rhodospirillales bacterium]
MDKTQSYIDRDHTYVTPVYKSLPVVLERGEGVWMWDTEGRKYLDFLSAYSAVSFGHLNPRIKKALIAQLEQMDIQARSFLHKHLGEFAESVCTLTGLDQMIPMNTGAEAVETGIKTARRWGHMVKGIPDGDQRIIVCKDNFHGRTTTIIGFSSDADYRRGFGPFDGGFDTIPFGDASALERAITPQTCAVLVEPLQGEGGIHVAPKGWLKQVQDICKRNNVLLLVDEIQTGMGRTGKNFCYQHEIDRPDGVILGKALGGGIYPVSAFVSRRDILEVMTPGSHGSTFGGNAIASAIAVEALKILTEEHMAERAAKSGAYLQEQLRGINSSLVQDVRGLGLLIGMELDTSRVSTELVCAHLLEKGLICKDTHGTVVRFAPPLTIEKDQIDWAVEQVRSVLAALEPVA